MKINFKLNGTPRSTEAEVGDNVQALLQKMGCYSVRNSDDGTGFTGCDIIDLDGKLVSAGLLIAAQINGREIKTVESLSPHHTMSSAQSALVDAGVVQSAYNSPAAALILTDLLQRIESPTRADIVDAFSGLYIRDVGYEQYFLATELAKQRLKDPAVSMPIAEEFRDDLKEVGKVRRKIDGSQLVMGKSAYVEDKLIPGYLTLKMLRSPHAHAYIKSIDTSKAEKMAGVELVITYLNCSDEYFTTAGQGFPEPSPHDRRMFSEKVRHVGDRVAAVIAETTEIALAAIAEIKVEYEVLKPVFTIEEAEKEGAPVVQQGKVEFMSDDPDNMAELNQNLDARDGKIVYPFPIHANPHKNLASYIDGGIGDTVKGFSEAEVVIDQEYETSQVHCTPCETHTIFSHMEGDRLVLHASTQVPWHLRRNIAAILGISENKVRVIKERVGGGYGSKQDILLEDVCAFATWKTGKPVYFRLSREEEFIAASTRHPMKIRVKLGAKKDGQLTAIDMQVKANTGPYGNHCLTVPMNACSKSLPLILCDNVRFDVTVFYTNIFPTGAYQGYGAPQGSFALQTALAELAQEIGMDHAELLEKNRVTKGSVLEILKCLGEGKEGTVVEVQSCGLDEAIKWGREAIEYGKQEESSDPDVKIGKGMVIIQQGSGLPGLDQSNARVTLLSDGSLLVHTGGADIGTGLDTVCAKLASEVLNADMDRISLVSGDTDNTPFDTGAYASSGTYFSGNAVKKAAEDLKKKILDAAAKMLDEPASDLSLIYPEAVKGKTGSLTFLEIARKAESGTGFGQIVGDAPYVTEDTAIPYGANFCQVAVNTKTGELKIQKYYAVMDCGTPINPELAEGQVYGGVLKSIGHTLWEEMKMDENGVCLNPDLRDYGVPMIGDLPEDFKVKFVYTEDPYGPYGGKSISEVSTNGASCVLSIAINDAVGVWMRSWPFTSERILKKMGKIPEHK